MQKDIRVDTLEVFRTSTLMGFQHEKEKKQRMCLHKWFSLTISCKVCLLCQKVISS